MSIRLVVEVLDHAPSDLTPAERLVLVVLAEAAREDTRRCWPDHEVLERRTGLGADTLRRVFQRLAKRGLEVRVPIGTDKRGRPVFAREGVQRNFQVPDLAARGDESPATSRDDNPTSEEGPQSHHEEDEVGSQSHRGGTTVPARWDHSPTQEAGPQSHPSLQGPSTPPQSSLHSPAPEPAASGALFAEPEKEKKPKPSRRRPETTFPGDFTITDAMRRWAAEKAPDADADRETEKFADHAAANDRRVRDWEAAWRNWLRNAQERAERYGARRPALRVVGGDKPSTTDQRVNAALALAAELEAEEQRGLIS